MTDESDDRTLKIHAASHRVMGAIACAASFGGSVRWTEAATALADTLKLVDARSTPEHDERTRDLEELTNERDAAVAERERQSVYANRLLDERNAERTLAKKANDELEKTRALVDELRAKLVAPIVYSWAADAWLALDEETRARYVAALRRPPTNEYERKAADVLDSLSAQAHSASSVEIADRTTVETLTRERDAARALVRTLEARQAVFSKALDDSAEWRALSARDRGHVFLWLGEGKQETRDPSRWTAAVAALKSLMVQT